MTYQLHNLDQFIFGIDSFEDGGKSEANIFFEYATQTYDHYMKGHDTFEDHDEELRYLLKEKYQGGNLEVMEQENMRLEAMLTRLDQEEVRSGDSIFVKIRVVRKPFFVCCIIN